VQPISLLQCDTGRWNGGRGEGVPIAEPTEENVFEMKPEEREEGGIKTLPGSLVEAIQLAERVRW
jgi:glutamine synthetase